MATSAVRSDPFTAGGSSAATSSTACSGAVANSSTGQRLLPSRPSAVAATSAARVSAASSTVLPEPSRPLA
ncbi:hypothetical protein KALB_6493 [Kutzneria albida DSM 43870]|uniref:Uncharacterized protein n=2 Tax=Kutzneria TaxID=43356 RepID=W5WG64_9PSEU|nr:hypothetical protein KALB_6493 [Kutzneria albida DSM 43870]